jgi:tetratricopeptide (TPR) repeat protein
MSMRRESELALVTTLVLSASLLWLPAGAETRREAAVREWNAGTAALKENRFLEARAHFQKAIDTGAMSGRALAGLYVNRGLTFKDDPDATTPDFEMAISDFTKAIETGGLQSERLALVYKFRCEVHQLVGNREAAQKDCKTYLTMIGSKDQFVLFGSGNMLFIETGDPCATKSPAELKILKMLDSKYSKCRLEE